MTPYDVALWKRSSDNLEAACIKLRCHSLCMGSAAWMLVGIEQYPGITSNFECSNLLSEVLASERVHGVGCACP